MASDLDAVRARLDEWAAWYTEHDTHIEWAMGDEWQVLTEFPALVAAVLAEHPNVNDGDCGTCVIPEWGYPTHGGARAAAWPCPTVQAIIEALGAE